MIRVLVEASAWMKPAVPPLGSDVGVVDGSALRSGGREFVVGAIDQGGSTAAVGEVDAGAEPLAGFPAAVASPQRGAEIDERAG